MTKKEKKELKSIIKQEVNKLQEKEKKQVKKDIEKQVEEQVKDTLSNAATKKEIEDICRNVLQSFHNMMFKDRHLIKNKLRNYL